MILEQEKIETLDWQKVDGLLPAIVQDHHSLQVLMLGYMNAEALRETLEKQEVVFYSRSRKTLWRKGETSGHTLALRAIKIDCDKDTLLILAEPNGPTCHTGSTSCFGEAGVGLSVLAALAKTIAARWSKKSDRSYTAKLFESGLQRMAQKVGEEGVEVALSALSKDGKLGEEAADLVYHLLVLLEASDVTLWDVLTVLQKRAGGKAP